MINHFKVDFDENAPNGDNQTGVMATISSDIVVTAGTKKEAIKELLCSIAVLLADNSGIQINYWF